ncbi:MAG: hypothetical protein LLG02_07440 [Pelosinus sp.]|nr:hypothetical protein [Pelosinus sp.]
MAKYRTSWTEDKIARYIKEGRGSSEGNTYKPWLTIQDVPSMGRVTRLSGWKTSRLHYLLSDNETQYSVGMVRFESNSKSIIRRLIFPADSNGTVPCDSPAIQQAFLQHEFGERETLSLSPCFFQWEMLRLLNEWN